MIPAAALPRRETRMTPKGPLSAALLALLVAAPAAAQTVQGTVTDSDRRPVPGALVLLVDASGRQRAGALTDGTGRYTLQAPGAGTYEVRAERVGQETARSASMALAAGDVRTVPLEMSTRPVVLEEVAATASGGRRCSVRPQEAAETARLWEEARKALNNAAWTRERQPYRYEAALFSRDLDAGSLAVLGEERKETTSTARHPFTSLPVADLSRHGYRRDTRDGTWYYAPDAEALLSDAFLGDHCFRVQAGEGETAGLVGLAFEPVRGRDVTEVEGTLWIRRDSAALRYLEYRYRNLSLDVPTDRLGGRVDFERLPNGAWIVRRWRIRMPALEIDQNIRAGDAHGQLTTRSRQRLRGVKEEGGEVLRVLGRDGTPVVAVRRGAVAGVVWDEGANAPLGGAKVFISGTQHLADADAEGRFRLDGVPAGTYALSFFHPAVDERGAVPPTTQVTVGEGDTDGVRLALAPAAPAATASAAAPPTGGTASATRTARAEDGPAVPVTGVSATAVRRQQMIREFHARAERGGGRYITRERIERMQPTRTTDLFRGIPGLEVMGNTVRLAASGGTTPTGRSTFTLDGESGTRQTPSASPAGRPEGQSGIQWQTEKERAEAGDRTADCQPTLYVDGTRFDPTAADLTGVDWRMVEGIEVYVRAATAPAQFKRQNQDCAIILVWLKPSVA